MMNSKFECGDQDADGDNGEGDCNNGQLLHDIEEISKALYLNNTPSKGSFSSSSSHNRSKSAEKSRVSKPKVHLAPRFHRDDLFHKEKKLSSLWNWKKPLKALTHIGHRKFNCCFNLHVHSIEGLPSNFNGLSLYVHWKRKSSSLQTRSSRVFLCAAEFDETLTHGCSIYGSRNGTSHSVKYDSKRFLIYASIVGAPEHDLGHHLVDLTRLLPLTLEELRGDKSSGKWSTSFRLAGKANGATLNVSFSYQVLKDELVEFGGNNPFVLNHINLEPGRPSITDSSVDFDPGNRDIKLWQAGSFAHELHNRSVLPSHSADVKLSNEVLLNSSSSLSKSISLLYQKLDEGSFRNSARVNLEHMEPSNSQFPQESNEHGLDGTESDDTEFSIIEQGVETPGGDSLKLDQARTQIVDVPIVEIINVDEIIKDDDVCLDKNKQCDSMDNICDSRLNEEMMNDSKLKCNSSCVSLPRMKVADTDHETSSELVVLDNLDPLWPMNEFLDQEQQYMSVKSHYKANKTVKRSQSWDDITESVASDFLNMLAMESGSFDSSCGDDPQSPREQLLRLFEKEALASVNSTLDFDANEEELGTDTLTLSHRVCAVDSDLSLIIQAAEEEHERASQSLIYRRHAKMLEDLETDSLMQQWGLNERDFENSPETWSGGFGSPIELPKEESSVLPSVGQGLGSFVHTKDGGFLRSMNPSLFRNAKNGGKLIVHASNPVVLPAKMGSDILEILLYVSSDGVEELCNHIHQLMPLQDITGKSIKHIVWDATIDDEDSRRQGLWQQDLFEEFPYGVMTDESIGLDLVSQEAIAPITICKIESLLIEGLRIQSGTSTEEAPSYIRPHCTKRPLYAGTRLSYKEFPTLEGVAKLQLEDIGNDVDGLMGLSVTLDQWLRLDSGIIEGDQNSEQIMKVLKLYHSKISELDDEGLKNAMDRAKQYGRKHGLLANDLTVAFVIQLRDPLRNYEPVGVPMLVLTQVERVHIHAMQQDLDNFVEIQETEMQNGESVLNDLDNSSPQFRFKINGIHLAGVNTKAPNPPLWGTANQQQSGFRWLRAAGMDSAAKHYASSKSRAIVRTSPQLTKNLMNEDTLWSFSCVHNNMRTNGKEVVAENVHIRNPDIIFPN